MRARQGSSTVSAPNFPRSKGDGALPAEPGGWRRLAVRAPLATFFGLAFGLTWIYHAVVLGLLRAPVMPWAIPGTYGPMVAALLVVSATDGPGAARTFWRGLFRPKVGWPVFVLAGVAVPALVVLSFIFVPGGRDGFAQPAATIVVAYIVQLVLIFLGGGGLNEEPGWRGFALPRMQRSAGPLKGSLALGVLWGIWHISLYLFTPNYNASGGGLASGVPMFLAFLVTTVALAIVFTWIYNRSRGSVLLTMFVHASFNTPTQFAPNSQAVTLAVFGLAVVAAIVVLVATRARLGWRPETDLSAAR